ncbi:hypothetical protein Tco_0789724 [Tanacetum coccineum]
MKRSRLARLQAQFNNKATNNNPVPVTLAPQSYSEVKALSNEASSSTVKNLEDFVEIYYGYEVNATDIRDDAEVSTSTVSVKLPMLKKSEYTIWAIRMKEYLIHTDYEQWLVVLNGNSPVQYTKNEAGKDVEVPLISA